MIFYVNKFFLQTDQWTVAFLVTN